MILLCLGKDKKSEIPHEQKKQQRSKTALTLILLIQWSCSLYRWKDYWIIHNFLIEHFSKFYSLGSQK